MRSLLATVRGAGPIIAALFILATLTGFLSATAWGGPGAPKAPAKSPTIIQSDGTATFGTAAEPLKVTFDRPDGFAEAEGYHVAVPLYPNGVSRWVRPNVPADALDVIGVQSYLLDHDVSGANADTLTRLVDDYANQVQAKSVTTPVQSTVAGHPALTQSIVQPGAPRGNFTYDATYVFAGPYLVQVMCQYDRARAAVVKACAQVLGSLQLAT
jgi:hypothetical protein